LLFKYDKVLRTSEMLAMEVLEMLDERKEVAISMAVCEKRERVMVNTRVQKVYYNSRLFLFDVKSDCISKLAEIDLFDKSTVYFCAMTFYKYIGNYLIFVGMTRSKSSVLCTFVYDDEEGLRELKGLREKTKAVNPRKLVVVDGEILGADDQGSLLSILYKNSEMAQIN
jgi:hypothetical protein